MKQIMLISVWMTVWPLGSHAQTAPDPPALTSLRQRYQALLLEAEGPARVRWLAALEAMERQKAMEGDYDAAALLRERRLGLQAEAGAAALRNPILLQAAAAKSGTGLDFVDAKKEVVRFRRSGASMEWDLPGQIPGKYQVNLVCGVMGSRDENDEPDPYIDPKVPLAVRAAGFSGESGAGGVVEFRKITNLKEGAGVLRRSVRPTGGWATVRVLPLGVVELDSKIAKFSLKSVDALPAGLMDFHRLELVPVARNAGGGGEGSDANDVKDLTRFKEVYLKQFSEQTKTIDARYLKSLGELEVSASRTRDNDTLALVRQERKRIERGGSADGPEGEVSYLLPVTEKLYMLISGEAKLTSQGDYLTRLRPAQSCEISWKLAGLGVTSGTYRVEVDCRLTAIHGGTATLAAATPGSDPGPPLRITVKSLTFALGTGESSDQGKANGTTGGTVTRTFVAGKVTIPKGSEYLTLRVDSLANPEGALFDLKSLRLTPAATSP